MTFYCIFIKLNLLHIHWIVYNRDPFTQSFKQVALLILAKLINLPFSNFESQFLLCNFSQATINLCRMALEWNTLTRRQRKGLKMMYKIGCGCQIQSCSSSSKWCNHSKSKDTCHWWSKCEIEEVSLGNTFFPTYSDWFFRVFAWGKITDIARGTGTRNWQRVGPI